MPKAAAMFCLNCKEDVTCKLVKVRDNETRRLGRGIALIGILLSFWPGGVQAGGIRFGVGVLIWVVGLGRPPEGRPTCPACHKDNLVPIYCNAAIQGRGQAPATPPPLARRKVLRFKGRSKPPVSPG